MTALNKTAYCGIYCPDCIRYNNEFSACASQLQEKLAAVEFDKYAAVDSPFGANFTEYGTFSKMLNALSDAQCHQPCRVGNGCSGVPCKIMECCLANDYEGCWDCNKVDECEKFDIIEPRCGEMPKNNIRTIKRMGIENWVEARANFYIWQK